MRSIQFSGITIKNLESQTILGDKVWVHDLKVKLDDNGTSDAERFKDIAFTDQNQDTYVRAQLRTPGPAAPAQQKNASPQPFWLTLQTTSPPKPHRSEWLNVDGGLFLWASPVKDSSPSSEFSRQLRLLTELLQRIKPQANRLAKKHIQHILDASKAI